jgi:hypothetical protein
MKTDVILFKARIKPTRIDQLNEAALQSLTGVAIDGSRIVVDTTSSPDAKHLLCHAYIRPQQKAKVGKKQRAEWEKAWRKLTGDKQAIVSRLTRTLECPGASAGEPATAHYVVETDADKGWFEEISAWYDSEHMPGLATVVGTVHTVRFLNADHSPRSVACYELTHESVMGSDPWLAVRGTPWSDHCRPHFKDTLRTMFRVLA